MSSTEDRRQARAEVSAYHGVQLAALVARVGEAIDRHRAGEIDAYDVDEVLYHYSRSAKELWKFCNMSTVEIAARIIRDDSPDATYWWEQGAPRER